MQLGPNVSVTSRSAGNLDLFTVGSDGAVYNTWWYAGSDWAAASQSWRRLGGTFPAGAPVTAIAKSPDSMDLFIVGNDGRVYTSWWSTGQDWSGVNDNWKSLGGFFKPGSRVAATSRNPGNIDLFICGTDGRIYNSWWYAGEEWSGVNDNWRGLGGVFPAAAPVAAVSKSPTSVDLFVCGNDGRVYTSWWNEGSDWSGVNDTWMSLGGIFPAGAPVAAISKSPSNLDLFICGTDGRVYTSWWAAGQPWSGINDSWRSIGGIFPAGTPVSVASRTPANLDVFVGGTDGRVYTSWWSAGQDWSGVNDSWRSLGGIFPAGLPVAAISKSPTSLDLFVAGNDKRIYTSYWNGGSDWSGTNDDWRALAPEEKTFGSQVLTPAGTALGGTASITVRRDGTWTSSFHMHDSGAIGYDFSVNAMLVSNNGLTVLARHSGHVGGTVSSGARDDDHQEEGFNWFIAAEWDSISNGRLWVTKDYAATGVVGVVEDIAKGILDVAAGAVGGALGVVIALSAEAGQLIGDLGLGGTFGVIAGVVVFAFGGTIVLAIEVGVAVGAMTNALIKQRPLRPEEVAFVNDHVFHQSFSLDNVRLTNLAGLGGRAFTMPGSDGFTYVNIGSDAFDSPLTYTHGGYARGGQMLIHELTHAWQIAHSSFVPGIVCAGIVNQANNQVGQAVYAYPAAGPDWSTFNLEQQGAIVDEWFGGDPTPSVPNRSQENTDDPYFRYIRDNIRAGVTGPGSATVTRVKPATATVDTKVASRVDPEKAKGAGPGHPAITKPVTEQLNHDVASRLHRPRP